MDQNHIVSTCWWHWQKSHKHLYKFHVNTSRVFRDMYSSLDDSGGNTDLLSCICKAITESIVSGSSTPCLLSPFKAL